MADRPDITPVIRKGTTLLTGWATTPQRGHNRSFHSPG
jgi:hypothetical protein